MTVSHPEPLSGPDELMHLELLIADLQRCRDTATPFVLDDSHPLRQHVRATARQRALDMIRSSGERLRMLCEFDQIIEYMEDQP